MKKKARKSTDNVFFFPLGKSAFRRKKKKNVRPCPAEPMLWITQGWRGAAYLRRWRWWGPGG